jgi:lycopene cyclase domain-containing protein
MFTYLLLDLLIIAFPLALSFDKKVAFYTQWRYIWQGILLNLIVFLPWDYLFTAAGVWGFNDQYILGLKLFHLPLEEYLFFLVVPYAAIFIYACLEAYFPSDVLFRYRKLIALVVILFALFLYATHMDRLYTSVNTLYLSLALLLILISGRSNFLGRFFLTYLIILLPFLIFNGILTGMPVVWYNDAENLGIRLITIPADDLLYNMGMLLIPIGLYARLKK